MPSIFKTKYKPTVTPLETIIIGMRDFRENTPEEFSSPFGWTSYSLIS
jgi:hypothetical protein